MAESESGAVAVTLAEIQAAQARIAGKLQVTPLAYSEFFSAAWDGRVFFKFENLHFTGSFKERGALNRMLRLPDEERRRGVITASAGNHGQAVAHHAKALGIPAVVVMPVNTPLIKVQNTAAAGARIELSGANFDESVARARQICSDEARVYIHGFDDPDVIAGQGTLGLELVEQCPDLDCVVVPVGGGGLAAGVALAIKETNSRIRVVGVQSQAVPSMSAALAHGAPQTVPPQQTIADGVAVRHVGRRCFDIVRRCVDDIVTVSEAEIANAILLMLEREKTLVEGAGAVAVAALHNGKVRTAGATVACILSGGNIDVNILARIIAKGLVKDGRLVKLRVVVPDHPGQLSRILGIVAQLRANILEIYHNRAFTTALVGETQIDIVLETRGEDHIGEIVAELDSQGCHAEREVEG